MKVFPSGKGLIKAWVDHVPVDENAMAQVYATADMPFVHRHVALMPDVHWGIGATIGSVVPTIGAVIPAAVGVDIGCGMMAVKTTVAAKDLPDNLHHMRSQIERDVPVGFGMHNDDRAPELSLILQAGLSIITGLSEKITKRALNIRKQMGTLGGGNHFIEVCLDENDDVWVMLHSGSRGIGNALGTHFIALAKKDMERHFIHLPDADLAYLVEGSKHFDDYCCAVKWAQAYALENRRVMMNLVIAAMNRTMDSPFSWTEGAIECHHNYISWERHYGKNCMVTRKGAVHAGEGIWGIIPGSMGAKSFIVVGKGNRESFNSCSHGAGRVMSRTQARKEVSLDDHKKDTEGVECKKDASVLDETPKAYKNIDDVMKSQEDLVEIKHTLKQILCVKG